jgi:hypothetical protein
MKFGGDKGMVFMQTMFQAYVKIQKKIVSLRSARSVTMISVTVLTVNRKLGMKNTGFSVDKHLKIDKPLGTVYLSTEPRPIKVADTAPSETTRADEIVIGIAKTGKVTAVVAVMSNFSKKRCKSQSANLGNEKPSCQMAESANFPEENSCRPKNLSQKKIKGYLPKK